MFWSPESPSHWAREVTFSEWLDMWEGQVLARDPPSRAKTVKIGAGKDLWFGSGWLIAVSRVYVFQSCLNIILYLMISPSKYQLSNHDMCPALIYRGVTMQDTQWLWMARSTTSTSSQVESSTPKAHHSLVIALIFCFIQKYINMCGWIYIWIFLFLHSCR